jgi:hypothetical protein
MRGYRKRINHYEWQRWKIKVYGWLLRYNNIIITVSPQ